MLLTSGEAHRRWVGAFVVAMGFGLALLAPGGARAATDPGPRGGAPGAGGPLDGLTAEEQAFFAAGLEAFLAVDSVQGGLQDGVATDPGLGPRFNLDSCAGCHAHPSVGGTSPAVNPQVRVATLRGARNVVPWFVVANGPVREARYKRHADGTPDGGVTDLFVISGRSDAGACRIQQPTFLPAGDGLTGQGGNPNLIFRIPTPTFGSGLIEAISDSTILANKASQPFAKGWLGISGRENRSGNDGTITRFGWKAQNKSLVVFAGEAYNVEQGISNELFSNERDETPGCVFTGTPDDRSSFVTSPADSHSDVVKFAAFMRLLAPPAAAPDTPAVVAGRALFSRVGCALCHTPALRTGSAASAALYQKTANLYSDLLLHDMGAGLADGISQGAAGPSEFRTAPLWGLGQRLFFLHDGRATDLVTAIQAHASTGSEANGVIRLFGGLRDSDQQAVLQFLRSL
jgi:CxxC motif-containing protein (DUF1111 family)